MGVWVAKHCSWVWWFGWVMCTCYVLFLLISVAVDHCMFWVLYMIRVHCD